MAQITSAVNPLYKSLRELNTPRGRKEQGLFIAEGPHLAQEALKSGSPMRWVAVREDAQARHGSLVQSCVQDGAQPLCLSPRLFDALADTDSPQGILIVCEIPRIRPEELYTGAALLSIVLEHVQDPGNLGTMLRTALAVNAGFALLCAGSADPWSQKSVRASQGAVFHLKIAEEENAAGAVRRLNSSGWHTACGHLGGSDFFTRGRHSRTALVIGNEASGVSADTAESCCARYRLPMPGPAESLNAAVAAGIMLYDLYRESIKD